MGSVNTVLGVIAIACFLWYVVLIKRRNRVLESIGNIDVQLKMRADLIPNILAIAKKYMQHESQVFERIIELRNKTLNSDLTDPVQAKNRFSAEDELGRQMKNLRIQFENYPELKSDTIMQQAQNTYSEVEANLAAARRFYNSSVGSLNNAAQIFPGSIIAIVVGVKSYPFFTADPGDHRPVQASDHL